MDFKLTPFTTPTSVRPAATARATAPEGVGAGAGFSGAFKSALQSVSAAQNESAALQRAVQMENPKVSLEETMVAIQKAQIGFQATLHVKPHGSAYTDIMNMKV